jgi:hypothetical protein
MTYTYEPFVMRRLADDKIFLVSPKMPFEQFIDCFFFERPYFLLSVLDDGRLAITPNIAALPLNLLQGFFPLDLFPTGWEYVTVKDETYPVILTAHPVVNYEEWIKKFEKNVQLFAKETLAEFILGCKELLPIQVETPYKATTRQPVAV